MNGLVNVMNMFTEPLLREVPWAVVLEAFKPQRNPQASDESVAKFVSRRASQAIADNLVSAVFHGIYAGDIHKLSAQTLLSPFWDYELSDRRVLGEVVDRQSKGEKFIPYDVALAGMSSRFERGRDYMDSIRSFTRGSSVFTLKKGMGQIAEQLETSLTAARNVEIKTGAKISQISKVENSSDLTVSDTSLEPSRTTDKPKLTTTSALGQT
jgi:oxygen-dependent protoporphyrinogen oxidase